jgi:hypothetical protein
VHSKKISLFLALLISISSTIGRSESTKDPSTESINKVLDLLEKQIIDSDSSNSPSNPNQEGLPGTTEKVERSYKFTKPQQIQTLPQEKIQLELLRKQASSIENNIDSIESNVNKLRNEIINETKMDTFIELHASFPSEKALLRTMKITLDEVILTDLIDSSTAWTLGMSMPIFYGPIKPGSHRIQVIARLSPLEDQVEFAANSKVEISKIFEIHIPLGTANHKFIVEILPPRPGEKASIQLRDS